MRIDLRSPLTEKRKHHNHPIGHDESGIYKECANCIAIFGRSQKWRPSGDTARPWRKFYRHTASFRDHDHKRVGNTANKSSLKKQNAPSSQKLPRKTTKCASCLETFECDSKIGSAYCNSCINLMPKDTAWRFDMKKQPQNGAKKRKLAPKNTTGMEKRRMRSSPKKLSPDDTKSSNPIFAALSPHPKSEIPLSGARTVSEYLRMKSTSFAIFGSEDWFEHNAGVNKLHEFISKHIGPENVSKMKQIADRFRDNEIAWLSVLQLSRDKWPFQDSLGKTYDICTKFELDLILQLVRTKDRSENDIFTPLY